MFRFFVGVLFISFLGMSLHAQSSPENMQSKNTESPIQKLARKLDGSGGRWVNGVTPNIDLPKTANSTEVMTKYFATVSYDKGPVKSFKVLNSEKAVIDQSVYEGIFVETPLGRKLFLMQYQKPGNWWVKELDVP